ncbi:MAG: endonuclease III [Candidatus Terrybacteria bacterium RIFCSPHIGHO2_01_FULL_58_15]|uniref:Endonuclease III n=2 Tax=Candidatus Terryibacteriota TaxID=1817920 RepID=A0A1G2PN99_TERXR|nr:MAG: endonuclease III [Candidatus Terrybacteria bacterium RIFCSPHIGHO2_01_FULL_58_15]
MGESAKKQRWRAQEVYRILRETYPGAKIALRYRNHIQLLVAVILSAQCTDKKVNEITAPLFKKYRTVDHFADANPAIFEQEIRSTGFYRAKARNIISAAKMLRRDFGGKLPRTIDEMRRLPGVARKTANVVLGNAYGVVEGIAVDTHVRRLVQRLGFSRRSDPEKIERDLMALFPKSQWFPLTYTLIEHGRAICKAPAPRCEICPVAPLCPTGTKRLGGVASVKRAAQRKREVLE